MAGTRVGLRHRGRGGRRVLCRTGVGLAGSYPSASYQMNPVKEGELKRQFQRRRSEDKKILNLITPKFLTFELGETDFMLFNGV